MLLLDHQLYNQNVEICSLRDFCERTSENKPKITRSLYLKTALWFKFVLNEKEVKV